MTQPLESSRHNESTPNRADFMRNEGTALFTYLAKTVLPEVIAAPDPHELTLSACTVIERFGIANKNPLGSAQRIVELHARETYGADDDKGDLHLDEWSDLTLHGRLSRDAWAILKKLYSHTFRDGIPGLLAEAYDTTMNFPLNLLRSTVQKTNAYGFAPVIESFEDIAHTYRQPWFQDVCTTAAMGSNGMWGGFSVRDDLGVYNARMLDLEFATENGRTIFAFSDIAVKHFRDWMAGRNKTAIARIRGATHPGQKIERYGDGTTSGCPVAHTKPHFKTDKVADMDRLSIIIDITGASAEELLNPPKTGIGYALDAAAGMFENCAYYINESSKRHALRQRETA